MLGLIGEVIGIPFRIVILAPKVAFTVDLFEFYRGREISAEKQFA